MGNETNITAILITLAIIGALVYFVRNRRGKRGAGSMPKDDRGDQQQR